MMKFERTEETAIMPQLAEHEGDAGMDLVQPRDATIFPFSAERLMLGIRWEAPARRPDNLTPMLKLEPRSSTATKWNLLVQPGVVDEGYTGELGIVVVNFTPYEVRILRGCRLAQAVLHWINEAPNQGKVRAYGGFGSTSPITEITG